MKQIKKLATLGKRTFKLNLCARHLKKKKRILRQISVLWRQSCFRCIFSVVLCWSSDRLVPPQLLGLLTAHPLIPATTTYRPFSTPTIDQHGTTWIFWHVVATFCFWTIVSNGKSDHLVRCGFVWLWIHRLTVIIKRQLVLCLSAK